MEDVNPSRALRENDNNPCGGYCLPVWGITDVSDKTASMVPEIVYVTGGNEL